MNKKFLLSWLVVFVVWMAGSFVVHGVMLGDAYASMGSIMRSAEEQEALFPYMLLAHVLLAGAFVWIYLRGVENTPWIAQGIRYGIAIALLAPIPTYLIYYSVQPTPGDVVVQQIIGDTILVVVLGIIVAGMNKPAATD